MSTSKKDGMLEPFLTLEKKVKGGKSKGRNGDRVRSQFPEIKNLL